MKTPRIRARLLLPLVAAAAFAAVPAAHAQAPAQAAALDNVVGLWRTIDDKTGKPRAEIRIVDNAGTLSGRIARRLDPDAKKDELCDKCTDDRKDKPVDGMEIIRRAKKSADEPGVWSEGEILDPENGKTYRLRLALIEGGRKLQVRGYLGPFYRTQVWQRAE
jgi:uncharacterized protein (DUF2147 family)